MRNGGAEALGFHIGILFLSIWDSECEEKALRGATGSFLSYRNTVAHSGRGSPLGIDTTSGITLRSVSPSDNHGLRQAKLAWWIVDGGS